MATAESLMNLGTPAEQALRMGDTIVSVTTTGAAQNSAGGLLKGAGNKVVLVNVAVAAQSVTLPADAGIGDRIEIYNTTANPAVVFPQTGGGLNQLADNASTALVANASLVAVKTSNTDWRVMTSAAI